MLKFSIATIAMLAGPALAEMPTGNDMLGLCADQDERSQAFCLGYITGLVDGSLVGATRLAVIRYYASEMENFEDTLHSDLGYCIPDTLDMRQIHDVFIRYLEETPQRRHEQAPVLLGASLRDAFPC